MSYEKKYFCSWYPEEAQDGKPVSGNLEKVETKQTCNGWLGNYSDSGIDDKSIKSELKDGFEDMGKSFI